MYIKLFKIIICVYMYMYTHYLKEKKEIIYFVAKQFILIIHFWNVIVALSVYVIWYIEEPKRKKKWRVKK